MANQYETYDVQIRCNATGKIRVYHEDSPWLESSEFGWTEGNYSCDCNRRLFFERAGGGDPDLDETRCGDRAYTVIKVIFPDGTERAIDEVKEP
jgi:hypothetical protein